MEKVFSIVRQRYGLSPMDRLLEQFLSTLPDDKRAMVRAAMGMEEVVQTTPKQVTLKQLSAKRAQVERRQQDMAKRVVETRKRWESEKQKLRDLAQEKSNITAELANLQLQDAI